MADLVVLNKTDRAGDEECARIRQAVAETGSTAAIVPATYGRIDPELLIDPALRPDGEEKARQLTFEDLYLEERAAQDGHGHDGHLHTAYESVDFDSDVPMDPRR